MGYYHLQLDEASENLCSFVIHWGKYKYLQLPMGIKNSPDIFQGIINNIFLGLPDVRAYLDNILVTSNGTYKDHLKQVQEVLERLSQYGFVVNIKKSFFAVSEIEYLGDWITRDGIQPQPKKVEAIHRLTPPKTKRQLRRFLGMVNYYRDMWKRRSHLIAPLTELVSPKFLWTKECQTSFEDIKKVISKETLLAYPDFNKKFHVYTDISDYQLGAVITQDDRPLAFYSRKLNGAQRRYTTGIPGNLWQADCSRDSRYKIHNLVQNTVQRTFGDESATKTAKRIFGEDWPQNRRTGHKIHKIHNLATIWPQFGHKFGIYISLFVNGY
jgi:hypothetical protein